MMRSQCFVFFVVALLLTVQTVQAQEQIVVETRRVGSGYEQDMRLLQLLGHSNENPLKMGQVVLPAAPVGTHLRVRYRSNVPFPIEVCQDASQTEDCVEAVLPPSEDGIALLDLTVSPRWNAARQGITVRAYTRASENPEVIDGSVVQEAHLGERLLAYLRHPFAPEIFTITSTNYLFGYRVGNVPVVLVLGLLMIVVALVSRYRSGGYVTSAAVVVIAFTLAYNTRFLADAAIAGFKDHRDWASERTFHEMGDLYAMAETLSLEEGVSEVTHCGDMVTPLRYLMYPISVGHARDNWESASHGVMMGLWDEGEGMIYCDDVGRRGEVIATFTDGGGVVRFEAQ